MKSGYVCTLRRLRRCIYYAFQAPGPRPPNEQLQPSRMLSGANIFPFIFFMSQLGVYDIQGFSGRQFLHIGSYRSLTKAR